jgi:hypothetical protein
MIVDACQRWTAHRAVFVRPDGATFGPHAWEVAEIPDDTTARAFVEAHHYSGCYPAARRRFGLYHRADLVGVAVFSQPMAADALRPFPRDAAMELGRFVLLDRVPFNAESWVIRRCLEVLAREGVEGVVMFSDPEPRTDAAGALTFRGHHGTIYQASGAVYAGRATPRTLKLLADGTVVSARTLSKIRSRERGWRYAVAQLVAAGAPSPTGDLAAWLRAVLPTVTRTVRHHGNHRYLMPVSAAAKRCLVGAGLPYPKAPAVARAEGAS